jgi:predicted metal-dependent phosphoesterase TrpH
MEKKMQRYIDLHCHTMYSDGVEDPKTLVKNQKMAGLDIIAKTDHDSLDGYLETKIEAQNWGFTVLSGVEFSTEKYHILGLGFDPYDKRLLEVIEKSKAIQKKNTKKMTDVLASYGMPISIEKVQQYSLKARLGKMNLLFTLFCDPECREYIESNNPRLGVEDIKAYYLGKKGIAGGKTGVNDLDQEIVVKVVHDAGGIVIPAHLPKDADNLEKEMDELIEIGVDGFEIQPNFYDENYESIEKYAKEHKLLLTYGSDYHGGYVIKRRLLGRGMNVLSPELEARLGLRDYARSERKLCLTG